MNWDVVVICGEQTESISLAFRDSGPTEQTGSAQWRANKPHALEAMIWMVVWMCKPELDCPWYGPGFSQLLNYSCHYSGVRDTGPE